MLEGTVKGRTTAADAKTNTNKNKHTHTHNQEVKKQLVGTGVEPFRVHRCCATVAFNLQSTEENPNPSNRNCLAESVFALAETLLSGAPARFFKLAPPIFAGWNGNCSKGLRFWIGHKTQTASMYAQLALPVHLAELAQRFADRLHADPARLFRTCKTTGENVIVRQRSS